MNTQPSSNATTSKCTALPDSALLERSARLVTRAAAALAAFCEHSEHNEPSNVHDVALAADSLRSVANQLAHATGYTLHDLYADRIRSIEEASLLSRATVDGNHSTIGADAVAKSSTWDDVQLAQIIHDRQFHPDVFGLSKIDQLRHYAFHVTKLAGLLLDAIDLDQWPAFADERLADLAIFGVKIATVCNERLPAAHVG